VFRRLFWLCMGIGVGFTGSLWLQRFVREKVARYAPERVSADVTNAVKGLGTDLRVAVADGRAAMREREAELRSETQPTSS
jgi:streptogramin lyase